MYIIVMMMIIVIPDTCNLVLTTSIGWIPVTVITADDPAAPTDFRRSILVLLYYILIIILDEFYTYVSFF